jgi:hypothetical protein
LVRPSLAVTTKVEAVSVAPAQPEGDASSAGTPEQWEVWEESWMPGPCVAQMESWAPRGER